MVIARLDTAAGDGYGDLAPAFGGVGEVVLGLCGAAGGIVSHLPFGSFGAAIKLKWEVMV
jgi:hypothetical protein